MHFKWAFRWRRNNPRNEKRKCKITKFVKIKYFKLIFISFDKEKVKNLIDYIIQEPSDDEFKRGHKYPFVSSELLNCDTQKLLDFFICTNEELIKKERKSSTSDSETNLQNEGISSNTKPDSPVNVDISENEDDKDKENNLNDKENDKENTETSAEEKKEAEEKGENSELEKINIEEGKFFLNLNFLRN